MYRYTDSVGLEDTKPEKDWWASTAYQLAKKNNLPTNGGLDKVAKASEPITGGKMAQLLASNDFDKPISEKVAIQIMYEAGLSDGFPDQYGNAPKTYESYGADKPLLRGQVTKFMKAYDNYLQA